MIRAGKVSEISWANGEWLILDIGFSGESKSCGLVLNDGMPERVRFADAVKRVVEFANRNGILNLVIEAPLSVAFDKDGNPRPRRIEKQDHQIRFWYSGAGPAVMIAAMYLFEGSDHFKSQKPVKVVRGFRLLQ